MPLLTCLVLLVGFAMPTVARELQMEIDVLHVAGLLTPAELAELLSGPQVRIEAHYRPTRLIDGVTARRTRIMPIGSRLDAIPLSRDLAGADLERLATGLRFRVGEVHPSQADYRLARLTLYVPIARGLARPQPALEVRILDEVPAAGAYEQADLGSHGAFELGTRVRARWSDAQGALTARPQVCDSRVLSLGNGEYRFRPVHRMAGLFAFLSSTVSSPPPQRAPAGQSSWRLAEDLPEPLAGYRLSRDHLLRMQVAGQTVERLSVYGERNGPAHCRRSRSYDALFADGQPVAITRSVSEAECDAQGNTSAHGVDARWLDDGSLSQYLQSSTQGSRGWHAFVPSAGPECGNAARPSQAEVEALLGELRRIRAAFSVPATR